MTVASAAKSDPLHTRFDHGLAEFPAFRFGKRRRSSTDLITFTDRIRGPSGEPVERHWTVYPSSKWGYGGSTTQALLFDLHQLWKEQGFRGARIHFGTLRRLYQLQHPGKNPAPLDYQRLRRDLDILCGYEFDCERSFWDPVSGTYGTIRGWHIFTGWYEPRPLRGDTRQGEFPFGFIEVSDTFAKIAEKRGFFVTGFDSAFFHQLRPTEQRLALYLSKMFASQQLHRRFEDDIFAALPIEAGAPSKNRQTLRRAVAGLCEKGYPHLGDFTLQPSRSSGRWVATFRRKGKVEQDRPVRPPSLEGLDPEARALVEEIVEETNDSGSVSMWVVAVKRLGPDAVRFALADLCAEQRQRGAAGRALIKNPGAWLVTKLMVMAKERGITIARHTDKAKRPRQ